MQKAGFLMTRLICTLLVMKKPVYAIVNNKGADISLRVCVRKMSSVMRILAFRNAPVICIPGSLGAGDSGDITGPKCRDLTFDESRQCRRCAGLLAGILPQFWPRRAGLLAGL